MGRSVSLLRTYECDSSSFPVCLAAALIKFLGGTPGATVAITLRTCVCATAPQRYVFIWLNKCLEQVSRESISIKVLHFNRVRASWLFISKLKEPGLNTAGHDELWGTSLQSGNIGPGDTAEVAANQGETRQFCLEPAQMFGEPSLGVRQSQGGRGVFRFVG